MMWSSGDRSLFQEFLAGRTGKGNRMQNRDNDSIRSLVREHYGSIAQENTAGCGCGPSCCGTTPEESLTAYSTQLGYTPTDISSVPTGSNLGLGCGNPTGIAGLRPGEVVLDLGSGAGFDAFLAAQQVGPTGFVIGVDMTPEMIKKARRNALNAGVKNVQFRLGEIEQLPVEDRSVDVVISNCVINLSPEKESVFREAFRVLKAGGRLAISDIVATAELPTEVKNDPVLMCGCMGGAVTIDRLKAVIEEAGFVNVRITPKDTIRKLVRDWSPALGLDKFLISANIEGKKPA